MGLWCGYDHSGGHQFQNTPVDCMEWGDKAVSASRQSFDVARIISCVA